ncbi:MULTISPECIES: hypothetical protein [Ensifer]
MSCRSTGHVSRWMSTSLPTWSQR